MLKAELDALRERMLSRRWRLENLYFIVDEQGQEVRFELRPAQLDFIQRFHTYNVILKARQLGFTTLIDMIGLDMAIFTPNFSMAIIAETKDKATDIFQKKVLYPYEHLPKELKEWCRIVSCVTSGGGGEIVFSNGSSIKVMLSARSGTVQFLHVSEYGPVCAKQPAKAKEILTGSFPAVHRGGFIFVESTAMGNSGHFYDIVMQAEENQKRGKVLGAQDFMLHFYPWWKNPEYVSEPDEAIPGRLLKYFDTLYAEHGIELSEEQMAWYAKQEKIYQEEIWREYPSYPAEAFKVAQDGAYYKRQFEKIYRENRITLVPYEDALGVYTSWDLGISDAMSIWFFQFLGKEIRVIDHYAESGEGLPHYISVLKEKGYRYEGHFAPHDISVRELSTGISRLERAEELGLKFIRVPTNLDVAGGIEAVRDMLQYCYFDDSKTAEGRKSLEAYRKEWDDKNGVFKDRPLHDWTSHDADSFRTMAVALKMKLVRFSGEDRGMPRIVGGLRKI